MKFILLKKEQNLIESLVKANIDPLRVIEFIDRNVIFQREANQALRYSISDMEYNELELQLNHAEFCLRLLRREMKDYKPKN